MLTKLKATHGLCGNGTSLNEKISHENIFDSNVYSAVIASTILKYFII